MSAYTPGRSVGRAPSTRRRRVRRSRSAMIPEALPVRLAWEALPRRSAATRAAPGRRAARRAARSRSSRVGRRVAAIVCMSRVGHGLVAAQDVVGLDAHRLAGDLGGHVGVAVAVAADPRAPAQERRHARRPGAGPARVAGRPRRRPASRVPGRARRSSARYSRGVTTNSDSSKNAIARAHLVERRRALRRAAATCATGG